MKHLEDLILELLPPGSPANYVQLSSLLLQTHGKKVTRSELSSACNVLVADGRLICYQHSKKHYFRQPLPVGLTDIPVLDLTGTPSERLGWIERWQYHRPSGQTLPVLRFLDGNSAFSKEELLEPTQHPIHVRWVELVRSSNLPTPTIAIPTHLIRQCHHRGSDRRQAYLAIAKLLKLVPPSHQHIGTKVNSLVSYLDAYYPGWSFGVDAHNTVRRTA